MRFNTTKRLLKAGKPAIGTWLNLPCVNSAEILAHAGWDWLTVDAEHGPMTIEMLNNMFTAIGTTEVMPLCRIPDNDPVWIKRILDAGAMGIVVPMVCSAEQAPAGGASPPSMHRRGSAAPAAAAGASGSGMTIRCTPTTRSWWWS